MDRPNPTERVRLDVSEVCRVFGRHTVTLTRWEEQGILPRSHKVNGRRCWYADEIALAEQRLAQRESPKKIPPEKALALAAAGRAARAANRELRAAAAEALAVGGTSFVARTLAPFSATGRLDEIPNGQKADAARALREALAVLG